MGVFEILAIGSGVFGIVVAASAWIVVELAPVIDDTASWVAPIDEAEDQPWQ